MYLYVRKSIPVYIELAFEERYPIYVGPLSKKRPPCNLCMHKVAVDGGISGESVGWNQKELAHRRAHHASGPTTALSPLQSKNPKPGHVSFPIPSITNTTDRLCHSLTHSLLANLRDYVLDAAKSLLVPKRGNVIV